MRPTLLSFDILGTPFEFHAYVVMIAIAFLTCTLMAVSENYKRPNPYPITPIAGLWIFLAAFVGARAYWIAQYAPAYEVIWNQDIHWYEAFFIWYPGLVFYGGLIGGLLAGIAYMVVLRVPLLPMGDIAFPWVPLGIAITRIGCFLNGCCWGLPTDVPWAVRFPRDSHAWDFQVERKIIEKSADFTVPIHPTQLYNAGGELIVFIIMYAVYRRMRANGSNRYPGAVMFLFPFFYGIVRFSTEIYRGDSGRPLWNMTVSEIVSLALIVFALLAYAVLWNTLWQRDRVAAREVEAGEDVDQHADEAPATPAATDSN